MTGKRRRPSWIPVVAAVIKKENQILLGQRPANKSQGGKWEFPGGKIESGESPEVALERELQEELGIYAEIGPLRLAATHNYGDIGVLLLFYEVSFWKGQPKALHHEELKWVDVSDVKKLDLPEANRHALNRLTEHF